MNQVFQWLHDLANNQSLFLNRDHAKVIRVHLHAPYYRGNLTTDQMNHKAMSEVRAINE